MSMLTQIGKQERTWGNHYKALYRCECGTEKYIDTSNVRYGNTISCGCYDLKRKTKHNMSNTKLYKVWTSMKVRCLHPNEPSYHNYGGRGIEVCSRWLESFENFYNDMSGSYAEGMELDRIDNDGNYEPSNCRWASKKQQANNKRTNRVIEHEGKKQTVSQWAEELGLQQTTVATRLRRGWSIEKALNPHKFKKGGKYA